MALAGSDGGAERTASGEAAIGPTIIPPNMTSVPVMAIKSPRHTGQRRSEHHHGGTVHGMSSPTAFRGSDNVVYQIGRVVQSPNPIVVLAPGMGMTMSGMASVQEPDSPANHRAGSSGEPLRNTQNDQVQFGAMHQQPINHQHIAYPYNHHPNHHPLLSYYDHRMYAPYAANHNILYGGHQYYDQSPQPTQYSVGYPIPVLAPNRMVSMPNPNYLVPRLSSPNNYSIPSASNGQSYVGHNYPIPPTYSSSQGSQIGYSNEHSRSNNSISNHSHLDDYEPASAISTTTFYGSTLSETSERTSPRSPEQSEANSI